MTWLLLLVGVVVAFAGMFAAGVLSVGHLLNLPVPCGKNQGCIAVAMHPASKAFGIPIAFCGIAVYLVVIFLIAQREIGRRTQWALCGLTFAGTMASGWLLYYSHTVIRARCPWCIASAAAMAVLLVLSTLLLRAPAPITGPRRVVVWGLAIITAAAVGTQAGLMQRAAWAPPIAAERLVDVKVEALVDAAKSVGPANAPVTIVLFADLWCPACRAVHSTLVDYQRANPAGVCLAFRHRPLLDLPGHQQSGAAAALAEIAAEHGKFWPLIGAIYLRYVPLDRKGHLDLLDTLGIDSAAAQTRIADADDPAVKRVWSDLALAEQWGVTATPTFIVFVPGHPPVSANQRTLERILNSPEIMARLAAARE